MYRSVEDEDEERLLINSAVPVSMSKRWFIKPGLFELIATMLIVFVGGATVIGSDSVIYSALSVGFTSTALIYLNLKISGGHHNPVVSLAALICARISFRQFIIHFIAQILGSVIGGLALMACLPVELWNTLGAMNLKYPMTIWQGIIWEGIITFMVVLVQSATMMRPYENVGKHGPIASGVIQIGAIFAAFKFTGACFNPVRALGPAIARSMVPPLPALMWQFHYVYWAGPLAGGVCAALLVRYGLSKT